jgi:DNA polymerase-3 subunit chi
MTKVDFYILPEDNHQHRHLFACRLVEKAYRLGHQVYIHGANEEQAAQIDQLLWSFRPNSFVPHSLGSNPQAQVIIDHEKSAHDVADNQSQHGLLVNLSSGVPDFFSRFERVSEIVIQDPQVTSATRKNYCFYRDRGYQLKSHDMRKNAQQQ